VMRALALATLLFATAFRYERAVTPGAAGPNRLDVDVTLLAGAEPGLRDVRLVDAQDREVGYMLVTPQVTDARWAAGRLLPIASTKNHSGFEVDLGKALLVDRLRLDGIAAPFLKRAVIEGSGDRARWTLLAEATVFDLPEERLRWTEVPFAAGEYRYVRVTWDDRASARVQGDVSASARERLPAAATSPLTAEVRFAKRTSEPGKSRYRLDLPGSHLPIATLQIVVPTGNVLRHAIVTEPRMGNGQVTPAHLGSAQLKQQQIGELVASEMKIKIAAPVGRELDLVIDDGNNPPLGITRVTAELEPQPWIYFETPDRAPLRIRYGNEAAKAPSYDIEAVRDRVREQRVAIATLAAEPGLDRVVTQAKMTIPLGAAVERAQFRTTRRILAGPVGLSVLVLDADVLARSPFLADVRIADPEGRQVPYLVERRAEPLSLRLTVPARRAEQSMSVYAIDLPYDKWPEGTRLVLETESRVFERSVTLRRAADSHRNREAAVLETAAWSSADPELVPPALSFDIPSGVGAIELVIDEGDNAPLPIASAKLLLPSSALRFYHPGTTLSLLYGNPRANPPRYDLALLAPRLFGEPAHELSLGPVDAQAAEETPDRKIFWIAIAVAAVVLMVLLARLLRN
jgi:Protein of unknown function (DUF3999)